MPEPERFAGPPLGRAGIAAACLLLTLGFLALGFPTRQLASRLVLDLSQASGLRISFQEAAPRLSLAGPGLELRGMRLATGDGVRLDLDRARMRPAWSTSWLRLDPAIHVTLEGPPGRLAGVLRLGDEPGFEGVVEQVVIGRLPLHALWPGAAASGELDARLSLRRTAAGLEGRARLDAWEGSLGLATLSAAVPFTELAADLRFGPDAWVELASLEARSPLYVATGRGRVAPGGAFAESPLELELEVTSAPDIRPVLRAVGVPLSPDGRATLSLRGTPAAPTLLP